MAIGLVILRRRGEYEPRYKIWGYPVVPVVFALSAFAIVVNQVISTPLESVQGLRFVLVGLPVYYLWTRTGASR